MRTRANKIEKEVRIERVSELIGDGYLPYQIIQMCASEWSVSKRTIERYLTHVYAFLKREMTVVDKDRILQQYEKLILKFEKKGDSRMALSYRQQRDKVMGLDRIQVEHSGKIEQITTINLTEIKKPNE